MPETCEGQHYNCPACFKIKCQSVQFQGIGAGERRALDRSRDKDMVAYKQARRSGLQPKHVFGTAEVMAQADTPWEAEHHVVMSPEVRKEFTARLEDAKAMTA